MIFFDLDGPLLDVSPRYYALYCDLLARRGYPVVDRDYYWKKKQERVPETEILDATGARAYYEEYARERKALIESPEYLALDTVQNGAAAALAGLSGRRLVLVTLRTLRANLERELQDKGLRPYFEAVLSAGRDGDGWKVKARLIREFCGDVPPGSVIVGDTEADLLAGRELGLKTVGVLSGIRSPSHLQQCQPDAIIEGIWDLKKAGEVLKDG